MSLSSLIVQREVATMRQVEEALARQVIYGSDLVTNLLEVARVDEAVLAKLLAESLKLPMAPSGELPTPPERVRALVPQEMAVQRTVVPFAMDDKKLVVAVADPLPGEQVEQLSFSLGMPIEQRSATAVRVRQAISRLYGIPLERRMQRLVTRLSGQSAPAGSMPPPLASVPAIPASPSVPVAPPSRQRIGTPVYGTATGAHSPATPASAAASAAPAVRRKTITGIPAMRLVTPAPKPPSPPPPPPPAGETAPPSEAAPLSEAEPSSISHLTGRRGTLLQRDAAATARAPRRRRGPLTAEVARHEAEEASDRDALLDLFFDFSRQFFDYAALFLVHGDIAEGRDAFGEGTHRDRVVGIGVPLDLPSMLSTVRDKRTSLVAKAPDGGLEAELLTDLSRPKDVEMAIVPLVVRTRVVALLVGDCGDHGVDRTSTLEVTGFAGAIGKAFERLIVRRKLDGFIAGAQSSSSPSQQIGRVDALMLADAKLATPAARRSSRPPPPERARSTHAMPAPPVAPPPPMNVASVRTITGPPIPREDPDSERIPKTPLLPRIEDVSEPVIEHIEDVDEIEPGPDSKALFDELGWETADDEDLMPQMSTAISVPAHRPPSSHSFQAVLPSIIVDIDQEIATILDRVLAGESDEADESELVRQGERAMRVIMARFPGPVVFERARIATMASPPRASECGPIMRLVARERRVALPFVLQRLSDADPEVRGWATHLLCELPYPDSIPFLLVTLRDDDASTRASAAHALAALARTHPQPVREALLELAGGVVPADRVSAIRAMIEVSDPLMVPGLVHALGDRDDSVVEAAHDTLVRITAQDFGTDARPWLRWWENNAGRHRVEWLIDALTHEVSDIRRLAGEQLRLLTKEYFGYGSELPARERERAQQRYRDWWITDGRPRFLGT
jgi:hypothetical protein